MIKKNTTRANQVLYDGQKLSVVWLQYAIGLFILRFPNAES
jgi:hypothetical protein